MMYLQNLPVELVTGMLAAIMILSHSGGVEAQRPEPTVVVTIDGDSMYQVLPAGAIPAISGPSFVSGKEAAAQMSEDEPVMGLVLEGESRAYSLWQLDAHEIVNDMIGETPLAVTW